MIFVTVGTHEQQFNRLIEYVDKMCQEGLIKEEVFMQIGYSTYIPKACKWSKLLSYDEMNKYVEDARVVITHGGPASFIAPMQKGKIPVIVPRQKKYDEHVNDHQLEFVNKIKDRMDNILVVNEISEIHDILINYDSIISNIGNGEFNHNGEFMVKFNELVEKVVFK